MLKVLYTILSTIAIVYASVLMFSVIKVEYNNFKRRPVILRQEVVDRPTDVEGQLAQLLGFYNLRLNQAQIYTKQQQKEIELLEKREEQLTQYITENNLPVPADDTSVTVTIMRTQ
jgi:hypothetical protein